MTTKTCPACASSNVADAAFCVQCGSPFEPERGGVGVTPTPALAPTTIPEPVTPPPVIRPPEPAAQRAAPVSAAPVRGKTDMPCFVKAAGGFFGCLFGLIAGLCLSLICVMPVSYAIGGGGSSMLEVAIIITVILVIVTTIFGISMGPGFLGKILTSIGDTFKWMTGSGRRD